MNVTEPRGGSLSALLVGLDGDFATVCQLASLTATLTTAAEKAITRAS